MRPLEGMNLGLSGSSSSSSAWLGMNLSEDDSPPRWMDGLRALILFLVLNCLDPLSGSSSSTSAGDVSSTFFLRRSRGLCDSDRQTNTPNTKAKNRRPLNFVIMLCCYVLILTTSI